MPYVTSKRSRLPLISILLCCLMLSNCASYDFSRRIVQQGNILAPKKIAKLHPGMKKEEVAILMGTSLMSPTFNNDRWDYAYTWRKGSGNLNKKWLTLYFQNDTLTRIEHHT